MLTYSSQNYSISFDITIIEFQPNDSIGFSQCTGSGEPTDAVVNEQLVLKAQHLKIFLLIRRKGSFTIANAAAAPKEMKYLTLKPPKSSLAGRYILQAEKRVHHFMQI